MTDPSFTPASFATSLLDAIGAPATPANVSFVEGWETLEGGAFNNAAAYNPLNTSYQLPGSVSFTSGSPGGGVQAYGSGQQGIAATAKTLLTSYYTGIVNALRGNNQTAAAEALVASPWAASHYGGDPAKVLKAADLAYSNINGGSSPSGSLIPPPGATLNTDGQVPQGTLAGTSSAQSLSSAPRILSSIDTVLNAHGLKALNPLDDARVVLARGSGIMLGGILGLAGLGILVAAVVTSKPAGQAKSTAKTVAGTAAQIGAVA